MQLYDALQELLDAIRVRVRECELYVVEGPITFKWAPTHSYVDWHGDWADYIELARLVKAPILYLEATPFDLEMQNAENVNSKTGRGVWRSDETQQWLLERLNEDMEKWREYNGQLHQILAVWFKEGVAHWLELRTKWWQAYRDQVDVTVAEAELVKEEDRRIRSQDEAKLVMEQARQLAEHERFREATSAEKREYMAQQLFPDIGPNTARQIASLAVAIYWWDIESAAQITKAERVRELRRRGESIKNIASMLKISEAKVRAVLDSD